jgi:hypothetical protein
MPYGFEALQEPLSGLSPFQATTVPQSIAGRHVATLDGLGRLPTCAVEPRPDVDGARTRGRHGFDIRLVMIGHDLVRRHPVALDGLPKEGLGTGRVAVLAEQDIDDHAILIDGAIQIPFLSLAKQEDLVHEPAPTDRTPMTSDLVGQAWPEGLDPVQDRTV